MRNGIVVCLGEGRYKNIGDYVQSVAAAQFTGPAPVLVERERLSDYSGEPVKLVMNGWFMFHPEKFPPAAQITPLFVSFHVRPKAEAAFFTPATTACLKAHEPIGCRSRDMVEMLARHGIRGEFSSCLTLTLGTTFRHRSETGRPVFVDPWFVRPSRKKGWWKSAWWVMIHVAQALAHPIASVRLSRKFKVFVNWPKIAWFPARLAYAAVFYRIYSTLFAPEVLLEADYVCHAVAKAKGRGDDYYLELAKKMLHRYETASFVVTSRLHCTLPCIGMGTPVWTVVNPRMTTGRFGGNEDFMNLIDLSDGRLSSRSPIGTADERIHLDTRPPVSDAFRPYAEALAEKCRAFYAARDEGTI